MIKPNEYLKISEAWTRLWRNIRAVKGDKVNAIAEVAKYAVKPCSLDLDSVNAVSAYSELIDSTYNRRLRSYGGIIRKAIKALDIAINSDYMDNYDKSSGNALYLVYSSDKGVYAELEGAEEFKEFMNEEV